MTYLYLLFAIFLELSGTISMKLSQEYTRPFPSFLIFIFYGLSFTLLTMVLMRMEGRISPDMPKQDRLFVVLRLKVLHHGISCLFIIEIMQHLHLTELMGADKPRNVIHYRFATLKRAGQYEEDHEVPVMWIDPRLHRTLRRS